MFTTLKPESDKEEWHMLNSLRKQSLEGDDRANHPFDFTETNIFNLTKTDAF